jgi:hypothetical protein
MSLTVYDGDFRDQTGAVFASWFMLNQNGPTACAVGFVETADKPWCLFYRRMDPTGAKTYLGASVEEEISAAPSNFGEVFFNFVLGLDNHFLVWGGGKGTFSEGAPGFIRTNGNPGVDAAMMCLIDLTFVEHDWGQEVYLREAYGAASVGSGGGQFGIANGKHKKQQPPTESGALLAHWWTTVTNRAYVQRSTFQFAQAWVRAAHAGNRNGQRERNASQSGWMPYSELARFFDNFHMPLLPPELDEEFLLKNAGLS